MPRFDVHRPPGPSVRTLLLSVQADLLDDLDVRVCVPLLPGDTRVGRLRDLNPILAVNGEDYVMLTQGIVIVPRRDLGRPLQNLDAERDAITRALDTLLTGFR